MKNSIHFQYYVFLHGNLPGSGRKIIQMRYNQIRVKKDFNTGYKKEIYKEFCSIKRVKLEEKTNELNDGLHTLILINLEQHFRILCSIFAYPQEAKVSTIFKITNSSAK